eukprot:Em0001g1391a
MEDPCNLTGFEIQSMIISSAYTALTFISVLFGFTSIILNLYYHHTHKDKYTADPMQAIFLIFAIVNTAFQSIEFFQWISIVGNDTACIILGAAREYVLISCLAIIPCFGTYLLIIMLQPKCFRVINEEKQRRYKKLLRIFTVVTFFTPILYTPWPFINSSYGRSGYVCWFKIPTSTSSPITLYEPILLFSMWAFMVWLFTVGVVSIAFYKYCAQGRKGFVSSKTNPSINAVLIILAVFMISVVLTTSIQSAVPGSFPGTFTTAVFTPLSLMVSFTAVIAQQCYAIVSAQGTQSSSTVVKHKTNSEHDKPEETNNKPTIPVTETTEISNNTNTTFFPFPKDDWNEDT